MTRSPRGGSLHSLHVAAKWSAASRGTPLGISQIVGYVCVIGSPAKGFHRLRPHTGEKAFYIVLRKHRPGERARSHTLVQDVDGAPEGSQVSAYRGMGLSHDQVEDAATPPLSRDILVAVGEVVVESFAAALHRLRVLRVSNNCLSIWRFAQECSVQYNKEPRM